MKFITNPYVFDVGACERIIFILKFIFTRKSEEEWGNLLSITWGASCEVTWVNFPKFALVRERFLWVLIFHFTKNWPSWRRKISFIFQLLLACGWVCMSTKRQFAGVAGWLNANLEGSKASPQPGVCCPIENPAVMPGEGTAWFSNYWSPLTLLKMMEHLQCFHFCRPNLWTLILLDIRWKRCIDMNTKKTVKDLLTEQFKDNNKNTHCMRTLKIRTITK